jgi:hypothetical protein
MLFFQQKRPALDKGTVYIHYLVKQLLCIPLKRDRICESVSSQFVRCLLLPLPGANQMQLL